VRLYIVFEILGLVFESYDTQFVFCYPIYNGFHLKFSPLLVHHLHYSSQVWFFLGFSTRLTTLMTFIVEVDLNYLISSVFRLHSF